MNSTVFWSACLLVLSTMPVFSQPSGPDSRPRNVNGSGVTAGVTAHRGFSAQYPENTLPAFQAAIDLNVDWVELDIHRTKDGHLVVCHDKSTKRTGDRDLLIAQSTLAELLEVDVAHAFRQERGLTNTQCPPQRIPLLQEAMALFRGQHRVRLSVQPKTDCVAEAMGVIMTEGMESLVGFNDGNLAWMSAVKKLAPMIPVFWDRPATSDIEQDIRIAKEKGFETLVININGITQEKISKVQSAKLYVGAWTVNAPDDLRKLVNWGIDRIYTDNPWLLIDIKQK